MASSSNGQVEETDSCARCGDPVTGEEHYLSQGTGYTYCEECCQTFEQVCDEGVTVRSRHGNREFHRTPYEAPRFNGRDPGNQTEALAAGIKAMREQDVDGLFIYQKTGSYWLIDEYLEAHPSIAEDVETLLESSSSSKSFRDFLPI